jgi:hypothetical protein
MVRKKMAMKLVGDWNHVLKKRMLLLSGKLTVADEESKESKKRVNRGQEQ